MDVKAEREKYNLTQMELAEATGIPRNRIASWELGRGKPKMEDAELLIKYFQLLNRQYEANQNISDDNEILDNIKIGIDLKKYLAKQSLTYEEASQKIGIPKIYIELFTKGLISFDSPEFERICTFAKLKTPKRNNFKKFTGAINLNNKIKRLYVESFTSLY